MRKKKQASVEAIRVSVARRAKTKPKPKRRRVGASKELRRFREGVGKKVRALRKSEGWTQGDLALLLGLTRPAISAIENGGQSLILFQAYLIADAFGVTIGDLCPDD